MLNELGQVHKENLKLEKDKLRLEKVSQCFAAPLYIFTNGLFSCSYRLFRKRKVYAESDMGAIEPFYIYCIFFMWLAEELANALAGTKRQSHVGHLEVRFSAVH